MEHCKSLPKNKIRFHRAVTSLRYESPSLPILTHLSAWLQKDQILLYDVHKVFAVDALASSHPLSRREDEVNDPAQISEMFNTISYSKVGSSLSILTQQLVQDFSQMLPLF